MTRSSHGDVLATFEKLQTSHVADVEHLTAELITLSK
jgi:hypothetical protein